MPQIITLSPSDGPMPAFSVSIACYIVTKLHYTYEYYISFFKCACLQKQSRAKRSVFKKKVDYLAGPRGLQTAARRIKKLACN